MQHWRKLHRDTCALVVIDMQDRFAPVFHDFDAVAQATITCVSAAKILGIPVVITEQYPKGLGPTVASIRNADPEAVVYEKTTFSAMDTESFRQHWIDSGITQVVLCGIESHVCVAQTAIDLIACDFNVFVVEDAISSRTADNRDRGLRRMAQAGAIPLAAESFALEPMGGKDAPEFKAVSQLIK